MRIHVVENPAAGRDRRRAFLDAVAGDLERRGHEVTTFVAGAPGDVATHVQGLEEDALDLLCIAGGDGTVKEAVNARPRPLPWPIGLLPVGTANLVARDLGLPLGAPPGELVDALLAARPWTIDLLDLQRPDGTRETAITTVGAGLDGAMVHAVAEIRHGERASGGYRTWLLPGLDVFRRHPFVPMDVTVDDRQTFRVTQVVLQNALAWGGVFRLSPNARMDSGAMEIVMARWHDRRAVLHGAVTALVRRSHRNRTLVMRTGQRVRIRAPVPVPVQIDGDPAGVTDVEVTVAPAALTLLRAGD